MFRDQCVSNATLVVTLAKCVPRDTTDNFVTRLLGFTRCRVYMCLDRLMGRSRRYGAETSPPTTLPSEYSLDMRSGKKRAGALPPLRLPSGGQRASTESPR
eukprot:714056-Prorocentrum_minimum.AAC.2